MADDKKKPAEGVVLVATSGAVLIVGDNGQSIALTPDAARALVPNLDHFADSAETGSPAPEFDSAGVKYQQSARSGRRNLRN